MLKKIIIFSTLAMFLSACVTGPEGYLKRSANNKIIDRKGFKGGKRAPLYNKKYISQAKKNVVTGEYEYDEFNDLDDDNSEEENTSKDNIAMYKAMIDHDLSQDRKNKKDSKWSKNKNSYPSLRKSSHRLNDDDEDMQNMELREELNQIKSMLHDTKREMANNRCPAMVQNEKSQHQPTNASVQSNQPKKDASSSPKKKSRQVDDNHTKPTIIEPIESL
jgi:hypothetical protein